VRNANGETLVANDNWWQNAHATEISGVGLAPPSSFESAVAITLGPGAYTALLSASRNAFPGMPGNANPAGVGLVEVYSRGRVP
jgi:hypothetical protein